MLKITYSEKGGAEQELFFENNDVTIGRVQGNSIVLARPNVSKRHATIMVRDGRISIVDQNSTNGTYVNGRRISAPRELVPDDRVYIGDYTIRAQPSTGEVEASAPMPVPGLEEQRRATVAMSAMAGGDEMPPIPTGEVPVAEVSLDLDLDVEVAPEVEVSEPSALVPPPPPPLEEPEAVEAATAILPVEVPVDLEVELTPGPARVPTAEVPTPTSYDRSASAALRTQGTGFSRRFGAVSQAQVPVDQHLQALRVVAQEAGETLFAQVDPRQSEFSDEEWQALSDQVMRLVDRLRREDRIPPDVDPYSLTQDVLFEFTGLGPLEELLGDETVRAVMVDGLERIQVRRGAGIVLIDRVFATEDTYSRVTAKLMALAGLPYEQFSDPRVEGHLPDGTHLLVLNPPLALDGRVLVMDRPHASTLTVDDVVAAGLATADQAAAIREAVEERRNIAVCGNLRTARAGVQNVILGAVPADRRVVVLENRRELAPGMARVVRLSKDAVEEGARRALPRLFADVLALPDLEAEDAALLQSLGLAGQKGMLFACVATSAAACLRRIELILAFANPALGDAPVRTLSRELAEVIVVLAEGPDGRTRVVEVVEATPAE